MKPTILVVATAALSLPLAYATDPPAVKEGLWSVHTEITNVPCGQKTGSSYTLCRDHAFDHLARERERATKGCSTVAENLQDNKYSSEIRCTSGTTTIDSKGTTTFQGETVIHSETHASYAPAFSGTSESIIERDEKYSGSCPTGVRSGRPDQR